MAKFTATIKSLTRDCRGTQRGYLTARIAELHLIVNNIGVHVREGHTWVSLPSKPWVKDGAVVTRNDGSPVYLTIMEFDNTAVRDAFSAAVIRALREFDPGALDDWRAPQ